MFISFRIDMFVHYMFFHFNIANINVPTKKTASKIPLMSILRVYHRLLLKVLKTHPAQAVPCISVSSLLRRRILCYVITEDARFIMRAAYKIDWTLIFSQPNSRPIMAR